jgi:hypothetical protein
MLSDHILFYSDFWNELLSDSPRNDVSKTTQQLPMLIDDTDNEPMLVKHLRRLHAPRPR